MLSCIDVGQVRMDPKVFTSRFFPKELLDAMLDEDTGDLLEYRHVIGNFKYRKIWGKSYGNELGRLAQGMPGQVKGTNTQFFIDKEDLPTSRWRDVTYGRIDVSYQPEKQDPNQVRLTIGGDRVNYPGNCDTPTMNMLIIKLLLNSVISTPGEKNMSIDIKDFYLNTPMLRYEYMQLKLEYLPKDFIEEYNLLRDKVTKDGYVYAKIRKGMYGLLQVGILAQELLENRLNTKG